MIFNKKGFNNSAQGTIEYLVIIAVIVVISLVVVGLFITLFDSPSEEITGSSSKVGEVAIGGISIVESVIDPAGDSLIKLSNNSSDSITLTKISVGGVDNNFSEQLVGLDSKLFSLSSLSSSCPCVSGQTNVRCELKIVYTTSTGIEKIEYRTINAKCVSDSVPVNLDVVVEPIVVITDCFDALEDPIPICTLSDLNRMREDLDASYILMNDIDASETSTWDNGGGWSPVGFIGPSCGRSCYTNLNPFTGEFDGDNHTISGLTINRSNGFFIGLFGHSNFSTIKNIHLMDSTILGGRGTGGVVGDLTYGLIENVSFSGIVDGDNNNYIGGIVGNLNHSTIRNTSSFGQVYGHNYVGGIVGEVLDSTVINSLNSSNIVADSIFDSMYTGGIFGEASDSIIKNVYNLGDVNGGGTIGGIGGSTIFGSVISNSFNTGTVYGPQLYIGGISGELSSATITKTFNTGLIINQSGWGRGLVGNVVVGAILSNSYWDEVLTNMSGSCFGVCTECTSTIDEESEYFGSNGIPFTQLDFDGNWIARANDYPILSWQ